MALGKNMFCRGVDIYNLCDTEEIAVSVTTYVGHSTATGPKVAISRNHPFGEVPSVIGTIDASIFLKNSNQDNFKYIIKKIKRNSTMENKSPEQVIKEAIGEGKDVLGIISLTDVLLGIVEEKTMTIEEAREALATLKESLVSYEDRDEEEVETCIVRRLTPTETARLQGFPDDYTKIDGVLTTDAPQYKSHGNSWATPCANFVSTRVEMELRRLGHEGTIKYATCCSGIEAQSVSVRNLDWDALFFSEIEPFPCRVLQKRYPTVPNLGDMTQIHLNSEKGIITNEPEKEYELPSCFIRAKVLEIPFKDGDLQVFSGGTPCQSISVAGKREGMAEGSGTRSSLAFHFQRIIDETKPTFTIWENVPGAFSSNGGADFIWFVNKCAESGYAMAWRVLDAQYTMTEEFPRAVPQRRRRIWLVGYRENDWRIPSRIVFESEKSLTGNPPERISGLGFKSINSEADVETIRNASKKKEDKKQDDGFLDLFASSEEDESNAKKVSQMIPLEDMPQESDFSKLPMVSIYEFAKSVGEPGYLGPVFRTDKKTALGMLTEEERVALNMGIKEAVEKFEALKAKEDSGELHWEGAEKIAPQILDNIGNAGILANGRILTMNCHEWTSGIQLSPKTYKAWEIVMRHKDWLKANELLPEAYDETVCGLSDVLEENPDKKYNLSWRACFGILKRAETRGKELPNALYIALISTIREDASIVKWVAINGKDTKKKETDLSEKESARVCFERYISQVANFDDIIPMPPKRKNEGDSDIDDDEDEEDFEVDDDGNPILHEEDFGELQEHREAIGKEEIPDFPNGCMNESGGETAPTIVASQYKGPGNTQDATVVAVKK